MTDSPGAHAPPPQPQPSGSQLRRSQPSGSQQSRSQQSRSQQSRSQQSRPQQSRPRLSRARVVEAAVAFADRHGLPQLSMRNLADELGVVPMALYKHVAGKEALLDALVDHVVGGFPCPPDDLDLDCRAAVRWRVLAAREQLARHPWARQAIESRTSRTPVVLAHLDAVAGTFIGGGLSPALTHHVMHALGNRVWGFSPELFNPRPAQVIRVQGGQTDPRAAVSPGNGAADPHRASSDGDAAAADHGEGRAAFAARFPNIALIATAATDGDPARIGTGCDEQYEFEFALDLLLDGVERLHRAGWRPTRK